MTHPGIIATAEWIREHCQQHNAVSTAAWHVSISTMAMHARILKRDDVFDLMTWQDLAFVQTMIGDDPNAPITELLLKRLVAANEQDLRSVLKANGLMQAKHELLEQARRTLPVDTGDWQALLLLEHARANPSAFESHWLDAEWPTWILIAWLTWGINARPDLHALFYDWLVAHQNVVSLTTEEAVLAPLVQTSSQSPYELLAPFTNHIGAGCLQAAAKWYSRHNQHDAVINMHQQLSPYSPYWDEVTPLAIIAHLLRDEVSAATDLALQLINPEITTSLVLQWNKWHQHPPPFSLIQEVLTTCPIAHDQAWQECLALAIRNYSAQGLRQLLISLSVDTHTPSTRVDVINHVLKRLTE